MSFDYYQSSPSPSDVANSNTGTLLGLLVIVIIVVKITVACCICKRLMNRREKVVVNAPPWLLNTLPVYNIRNVGDQQEPHPIGGDIETGHRFSYEVLARATEGFADKNLIGQGGFGYVHGGVLEGKEVAIKQLKEGSAQGEREFRAEVEIITRVHHKNLVSLVGYCIAGPQRLLVYEFVPNNTLQFHLHGRERPTMEWRIRHTIALGSAKGIAYLHEDCHPKIIHRDIKASNILLDHNFEAKVSDFGLAKFSSDSTTYISTRIIGTRGYVAPEYASCGKLTSKLDVYSFGVILLELITGRRALSHEECLVDWARPFLVKALDDRNYDNLVDPRLERNYDEKEMSRMVTCAAACVCYSAKRRPPMSLVVRALEAESSLEDLHKGLKPGENAFQYSEDLNMHESNNSSSSNYGLHQPYSNM